MIAEYFNRHAQTLVFTLGRLYRRPVATALTTLVIGITLALPAGLHLLVNNVNAVGYSWEGSLNASLFLADSISEKDGHMLASDIRSRSTVRGTSYISRQQALEEFRALSGFGEALELLDESALGMLFEQRLAARGLRCPESVTRYVLRRVSRSAAAVITLVEAIDRASLAAQREVTIPLVRELLEPR